MNTEAAPSRILVVEDEGIVAADIEDRLKLLGYEVVALVDDGIEAIAKAAELSPDLVLMDIMLRGPMDGVEAANRIRAELHLPIIYLTASSNSEVFLRACATEPFGFILKPFDEASLRLSIEIALYKHRMERERDNLILKLQDALAKVHLLSGLLPICAGCKNIRDDTGYWKQIEVYLTEHSDARFTHGLCPVCVTKLYGDAGVDESPE